MTDKTFDDWMNAYDTFRASSDQLKSIASLETLPQNAAGAAQAAGMTDRAVGELASQQAANAEFVGPLRLGAVKAQKSFSDLSKRENLEGILGSLSIKELKGVVDSYDPDLENAGSYSDAAEIHVTYRTIDILNEYVNEGELNRRNEKALTPVAIQLVKEDIDKEYADRDQDDPETEALKQAELALVAAPARSEYRASIFAELAPDAIERKKKEFYNEIGSGRSGLMKNDIVNYISATIRDGQIPGIYEGLYKARQEAAQNRA